MSGKSGNSDFSVTPWIHHLGGWLQRHQRFAVRMGNLESRLLRDTIDAQPLNQPIYVTGLARAGTTILLEMLAAQPGVVSHQYRDYPLIYWPYWWNWFLRRIPAQQTTAVERAHRDGILITPESPEAMEEVLWMSFFPDSHDQEQSNVLDGDTRNPAFEAFYRDHLRKLLAIRGDRQGDKHGGHANGNRYLSKGNYNITRMAYLQRLFPDARFIVPIREPITQIASLQKQHRLFLDGMVDNPRAVEHLRRVGHFEFGHDRRVIHTGKAERVASIRRCWEQGDEVRGWARYWSLIHDFIADQLTDDPRLADAVQIVHYRDLCSDSERILREVHSHCGLTPDETLISDYSSRLAPPAYYQPDFSDAELAIIQEETAATTDRFGINPF